MECEKKWIVTDELLVQRLLKKKKKNNLNVYSTDGREEIGKTGDHSRHFQTST